MSSSNVKHRIVIVGGGSAGITVAARLRRSGERDVAVLEPKTDHHYQPMWTLIGGGVGSTRAAVRPESSVMPKGVHWIKDAVTSIDPDKETVTTSGGLTVGYEYLVVCPGVQLNWEQLAGLEETLGRDGVCSVYRGDLAPVTWEMIRPLRSGTAIFAMPSTPIKCPSVPQKLAYLAADWWRRRGVLENIHIVLAQPTPALLPVPEFAEQLAKVAQSYGIEVLLEHEVIEVSPEQREVVVVDHRGGAETKTTLHYDFLHAIPPHSAPDWLRQGPLSDGTPTGYVAVNKNTLQHVRFANVFALGDAANTPNRKTAASVRKQAPVVVHNLRAAIRREPLPESYDGYAACPFTTRRNRVLMAEFDYSLKPRPSVPLINTKQERYDMWLLTRYGLVVLYWKLMLNGLA